MEGSVLNSRNDNCFHSLIIAIVYRLYKYLLLWLWRLDLVTLYDIRPYKMNVELNQRKLFGLTPKKIKYLNNIDRQCTDSSFEDQIKEQILEIENWNCTERCTPFLLPFDDLPICEFNSVNRSDIDCSYQVQCCQLHLLSWQRKIRVGDNLKIGSQGLKKAKFHLKTFSLISQNY